MCSILGLLLHFVFFDLLVHLFVSFYLHRSLLFHVYFWLLGVFIFSFAYLPSVHTHALLQAYFAVDLGISSGGCAGANNWEGSWARGIDTDGGRKHLHPVAWYCRGWQIQVRFRFVQAGFIAAHLLHVTVASHPFAQMNPEQTLCFSILSASAVCTCIHGMLGDVVDKISMDRMQHHVCLVVCMNLCIDICVHMYLCAHIHTYTHPYVHTHVHVRMRIHTCTCVGGRARESGLSEPPGRPGFVFVLCKCVHACCSPLPCIFSLCAQWVIALCSSSDLIFSMLSPCLPYVSDVFHMWFFSQILLLSCSLKLVLFCLFSLCVAYVLIMFVSCFSDALSSCSICVDYALFTCSLFCVLYLMLSYCNPFQLCFPFVLLVLCTILLTMLGFFPDAFLVVCLSCSCVLLALGRSLTRFTQKGSYSIFTVRVTPFASEGPRRFLQQRVPRASAESKVPPASAEQPRTQS